ncbi:MAG: FtsW/RodA/SpoVE family cell cycle protein [Cellulosilyticaceae bacterium]
MNHLTKEFLMNVLKEVKYSKIHPHIQLELEDHIECLKEDYIEQGLAEDESYQKALTHMGDPESIGKQLHKIHKPKLEWSVMLSVILLIGIGLMTLYYTGKYDYYRELQGVETLDPYIFLRKQIQYIMIGILVSISMYFMNYRKLERLCIVGYITGLLLLVYGKYRGVNDFTIQWIIQVGPFAISSTLLSIPILVISFVGLIHRWGKNTIRHYCILGAVALLPIAFISQQGIRHGVILGIIFIIILTAHLIISPRIEDRKRLLSILYGTVFGIASIGITFLMYLKGDYLIERIQMFMHPEWDPRGAGFMPSIMQSIREHSTLIGDGGFSMVDIRNLPEPTNDLIFTFILGSMGWLIGLLIIFVITCIIGRMFFAALKITDYYGKLLCISIASLFTIQFVYNIAMNLGYLPQIGVALPFVSYQGISIIIDMGLVGLFLSVYRKKDIVLLEKQTTSLS